MYAKLKKGDVVWLKALNTAGTVMEFDREENGREFYNVRVATIGNDGKPMIADVNVEKASLCDVPEEAVVGAKTRERFWVENFGPRFAEFLHSANKSIKSFEEKDGANPPDYREEEMLAAANIFLHVLWSLVEVTASRNEVEGAIRDLVAKYTLLNLIKDGE